MKLIVLAKEDGVFVKLLKFSPMTQFVVVNDIVSLHNAVVKSDFDGMLLDCSLPSIWNNSVYDHLQQCNFTQSCYYFNSQTVSETNIELYSIKKPIQFEPIICTTKNFTALMGGSADEKPSVPSVLTSKLSEHHKDLLHFFFNNEGKLLTFKDMSEYLFGSFTEQHKKTIYSYIHSIRSCIEDNPRNPKHLIRKEKGKYTYI